MNVKKVLYEKVAVPTVMYGSESWGMKVTERQKLNVCSDRILTCRIKSIRSPAKVGLVVTDLITSPVVSWEGWETPPPQHRGSAVILCSTTGVVRPLCSCGDLLLSSARLCVYVLWMWTGLLSLLLSIFLFSFLSLEYVKGFKDLSRGGGQEVWCLPGKIRSRSPPHLC